MPLNPAQLAALYDAAYTNNRTATRQLLRPLIQSDAAELARELARLASSPIGSVKTAAMFIYGHLDIDQTERGTRIVAVKGEF